MRDRSYNFLARLLADRRGNIAVIFALTLVPLLTSVGCAVDYAIAARTYAKFVGIADSSALAGVTVPTSAGSAASAQTAAQTMFNGLASTVTGITVLSSSAVVTDSGLQRTAVVSFSVSMPTNFLGIIGLNTLTIAGATTATVALPAYVDFYILLDNSPSMGVGAIPTDVATMVANTPDQCAFACHDVNDPNNYYNLAKSLGVTMRIDVVRSATQSLMDTAAATQMTYGQFRAAIYTFGSSSATAGLTTITPLTSSLSAAQSAASAIDLMTVQGQNQFDDTDTNYDAIILALGDAIPTPGDGSSSSSPQKFIFFVSDGVADQFNAGNCSQPTLNGDGRCQEPLNLQLCSAIKQRGIQIAVLYTTYLPLTTNAWYNTTVAPWAGTISTNMQSCASPGYYFEVSPTQGISDAMNALFQKAVASSRISQ